MKSKFSKLKPWSKALRYARLRCRHEKVGKGWYFRKGIKCLLTSEEVKILWYRDKAFWMNKPTLDRIKREGDYTFENCRFLEFLDNLERKLFIKGAEDRSNEV